MFADPDLRPARQAALIDDAYLAQAMRLIGRVQPNREEVAGFLGTTLSEPKAHVFFDAPDMPLGKPGFARTIATQGVRLDPKTRMLHRGESLYINGETVQRAPAVLRRLADARYLESVAATEAAATGLLYAWYQHGWLHTGRTP